MKPKLRGIGIDPVAGRDPLQLAARADGERENATRLASSGSGWIASCSAARWRPRLASPNATRFSSSRGRGTLPATATARKFSFIRIDRETISAVTQPQYDIYGHSQLS